MDEDLKKQLAKIAGTIRGLSMDAVQKADRVTQGCRWGAPNSGLTSTAFDET